MRTALSIAGVAIFVLTAAGTALAQGSGAEARLKQLNITLPADQAPAANFVNAVQAGKLLFLSGNTPGGQWPLKGKVGKDLTIEQGYESARQTGLIMLGKIRTALGSLDRVKRVVKVLGMLFNDWVRFDHSESRYADRDLIRVFADENVPTYDFLIENGVEFIEKPIRSPDASTVDRIFVTKEWHIPSQVYAPRRGRNGSGLVRRMLTPGSGRLTAMKAG